MENYIYRFNSDYNYQKNNRLKFITSDIIAKMSIELERRDYFFLPDSEKFQVLDEELKRFIAKKISVCGHFVSDDEALETEVSELLTQLYEFCDKESDVVYQVTHYILGIIYEIQGYSVIFCEERDEQLIDKPLLKLKGDTLDEVVSHSDTAPVEVFKEVYAYLKNKLQGPVQKRVRLNNNLPKNGD